VTIHRWLHRKGIARMLNSASNSDSRCSAYIEARGPRWLAIRLAMYALRRSRVAMKPDWRTVRLSKEQQPDRWDWRFLITYRRLNVPDRSQFGEFGWCYEADTCTMDPRCQLHPGCARAETTP
jgi:hypothetical protein